jgi:hypothetical protein
MIQTVTKNDSFGGVQVLYIGDLLQLPPVIETRNGVRCAIITKKFFSLACRTTKAALYRIVSHFFVKRIQSFQVLNNLRDNKITASDVAAFK